MIKFRLPAIIFGFVTASYAAEDFIKVTPGKLFLYNFNTFQREPKSQN